MTVKELKEKLERFDDNLIVMIPRTDVNRNETFPYITVNKIIQGVNETDGCIFLEDRICCENCIYYDNDLDDQPCCACQNYINWEENQE